MISSISVPLRVLLSVPLSVPRSVPRSVPLSVPRSVCLASSRVVVGQDALFGVMVWS